MASEFEGTTVALVGHCGPDMFALRSAIRSALPGAEVVSIESEEALASSSASAQLLLINRVLDGQFDDESGMTIIERYANLPGAPRVMLISNFPDAQAAAEEAGAAPGFGKSELYSDQMKQRLRDAMTA